MTTETESAVVETTPIPQVGAILHLNTDLDPGPGEDHERGGRHWRLDGSCVLVSPEHVLTIRHTTVKTGRHAAFLPYEGLVFLTDDRERDYRFGDTVDLIRLSRPVRHTAPLPWEKVKKDSLHHAVVAGYGRWQGVPGAARDGVQRHVLVRLGMPGAREGGPRHYDRLDLCWWSAWNGDVAALRNNSGGPMLRPLQGGAPGRFSVVGLSRQENGLQQIGAWVTRDRNRWLGGLLPDVSHEPVGGVLDRRSHPLVVRPGAGTVVKVPAPSGARHVLATLCATDGIRLQMGLVPAPEPASFLDDVAGDGRDSGRFLRRDADLPAGSSQVAIGVAAVRAAEPDPGTEQVAAQLCCVFT